MNIYQAKQVAQFYATNEKVRRFAMLSGVSYAIDMCHRIQNLESEGKVMRWLGFIQGTLWREGVFSIAEMKEHNKKALE